MSQHIGHKGDSKISVRDFLPTARRKKNITVQDSEIQQMEKQFLGPFPSRTADGVVVGLPVSLTQTTHVMVIIRNNKWCHGLPLFIAEITFRRCGVNIRQHKNVFTVSPQYGCQVTPCSHFNVTPFQFHFR
jgi:hypothetical protein